jgi:hypothetical protein
VQLRDDVLQAGRSLDGTDRAVRDWQSKTVYRNKWSRAELGGDAGDENCLIWEAEETIRPDSGGRSVKGVGLRYLAG